MDWSPLPTSPISLASFSYPQPCFSHLGIREGYEGKKEEEQKKRTMLVVQVRKRTVQTPKVQVNGIRLLCLDPLGPDTHGRFFTEGDTSCPDKFFFEKYRGRGGRQAPWDELFQASCPHHGCGGVEGTGTFLVWGKHPYSLKTGQGLLCYQGSEFR